MIMCRERKLLKCYGRCVHVSQVTQRYRGRAQDHSSLDEAREAGQAQVVYWREGHQID